MEKDYRIKDLYPDVALIKIHYKQKYVSAFGIYKEEHDLTYTPEQKDEFIIYCINRDCTQSYFDLRGDVSHAIIRHETVNKTVQCTGNEADDHPNRCPVMLTYTIQVEYLP